MIKTVHLLYLFIIAGIGCSSNMPKTEMPVSAGSLVSDTIVHEKKLETDHEFKYDLNKPSDTNSLDNDLEEISGLAISVSGEFLYAVQDEKGLIYKLSKETGNILEKTKFHKDGDYEGIEIVGDKIYVVKSTGTLYEVTNLGEPNQQLKKYNDFLSRENDVEGLGYDPETNKLLIACKGIPATGESFEVIRYKKVVYAFDLAKKEFDPTPIYTIQLSDIREYLDQHTTLREYEKLLEFFSAGKENLTFNPSAIAVHPLTKEIYVISSSGKVLAVFNKLGNVVHIEKLDKKVHAQPEGMVFDEDGTLYISNEGKGGKPKIHKFSLRR